MPYRLIPKMITLGLIITTYAFSSFEAKGYGSRFLAIGSTGIASADISFGVFINPSKLIAARQPRFDIYYRNFYGIKDYNQVSAGTLFKVSKLNIGLGVSRYGNKLYSESELRLSSAYELAEGFGLGVALNGYGLSLKNYGHATAVGVGLSGYYRINPSLNTAFVVSNINEPVIGRVKEKLPLFFALGVSYKPLAQIEINIDALKDGQYEFDYHFGIAYYLSRGFSLLAGLRNQVNKFSVGFSLAQKKFNVAYAFEYHPVLGNSNSISVGYEL